MAGWQNGVARYASGNSRLVLALSAAFAAPLLYPTSSESGGFHFRGGSSTGKTTALVVGGSVWGGGGVRGFIRTWRATSNGLEGVAAMHCDSLLCLDEMGQVDGREAGQIAYMLANGVGKTRAGRSGEARPAAEWRLIFLSSGELSLGDKIAEDGRGKRVAAGQQVRIIDIAADAGVGIGLFENPLLRMCFGNVVADKDPAENEKFTKERARGRIDGAVAAAMAVGRILANESGPSPYENQRPEGFLYI